MIKEFRDFINQGGVVTVAIALIMALFFQDIITAILDGVIMPLIAALVGEPNFADIGFEINDSLISIGLVINAVIMFVLVAFVLFLMVKAYNRMITEDASPTAEELLVEIRDELRRR